MTPADETVLEIILYSLGALCLAEACRQGWERLRAKRAAKAQGKPAAAPDWHVAAIAKVTEFIAAEHDARALPALNRLRTFLVHDQLRGAR